MSTGKTFLVEGSSGCSYDAAYSCVLARFALTVPHIDNAVCLSKQ